jgi:hypothetical protein
MNRQTGWIFTSARPMRNFTLPVLAMPCAPGVQEALQGGAGGETQTAKAQSSSSMRETNCRIGAARLLPLTRRAIHSKLRPSGDTRMGQCMRKTNYHSSSYYCRLPQVSRYGRMFKDDFPANTRIFPLWE